MKPRPLIECIASRIDARSNTQNDWFLKHTDWLRACERDRLPSGAGIDSGTKIDLERSRPDAIVFTTAFHHMTEHGYYDGWTEHRVTVRPSFVYGLDIRISGRDRNQIKDYLTQVFHECLTTELEQKDW